MQTAVTSASTETTPLQGSHQDGAIFKFTSHYLFISYFLEYAAEMVIENNVIMLL